ncbi:MerR family transcriptional regulator [Planomonospora sp. ID91781]|uniref:MerR family transcriptional regulator n=1 Tax=Planomonospora sphaerica TaxID=161355 RepID=A0A171DKM4_9ACTN|nr:MULTISPECIES: MerR family transcriptional regulator [Planomonospora]MBG0822990.1 MerR family transcriptional regulator [Planomonospora sp. ID91781]GAT69380.1 merR family transcriptional regulator [Planomonospora sphaerica]
MLIGELSRRTGVSTRLLRYYEEQGLLHPERDGNGYRRYRRESVERVARIRELLDAGLPTETIRDFLPCAENGPEPSGCARYTDMLDSHRFRLARDIAELQRRHAALTAYADTLRSG